MKQLLLPFLLLAIVMPTACTPLSREKVIPTLEEKMADESNPLVLMETSMGDMILELYPKAAPKTVENFIGLAEGTKEFTDTDGKKVKRPYYDGLTFHRVIPNFMIQGGDIQGDGRGGPGYYFEDEISLAALGLDKITLKDSPQYQREAQSAARERVFAKLNIKSQADLDKKMQQANAEFQKELQNVMKLTVGEALKAAGYQYNEGLPSVPVAQYTLAMANAGPNTNGSQFFLNLVDNFYLNGKHTVFGKVLKGRAVMEKIAAVERDQQDRPKTPVLIKKVRVLQ